MNTVIDRISTSELFVRYSIKRTSLNQRTKALKDAGLIEVQKEGTQSYVVRGLEVLDELDQEIKQGGSLPNFLRMKNIEPRRTCKLAQNVQDDSEGMFLSSLEHPSTYPVWMEPLQAIAHQFLQSQQDTLQPQRQLKTIVDEGWEVKTKQLRAILGQKTIPSDQYGYRFTGGRKKGYWKVEKFDQEGKTS
jgi:DNA-binding transcriptional ArsR family regulator